MNKIDEYRLRDGKKDSINKQRALELICKEFNIENPIRFVENRSVYYSIEEGYANAFIFERVNVKAKGSDIFRVQAHSPAIIINKLIDKIKMPVVFNFIGIMEFETESIYVVVPLVSETIEWMNYTKTAFGDGSSSLEIVQPSDGDIRKIINGCGPFESMQTRTPTLLNRAIDYPSYFLNSNDNNIDFLSSIRKQKVESNTLIKKYEEKSSSHVPVNFNTKKVKKSLEEIMKIVDKEPKGREKDAIAFYSLKEKLRAEYSGLIRQENVKGKISSISNDNTISELLDSCHIVPFSPLIKEYNKTSDKRYLEMAIDPKNSLFLPPTLHRAYDRGMIDFDDDGNIVTNLKTGIDFNGVKLDENELKSKRYYLKERSKWI